jgi:phosphate starvation-inducible protein PhoH and related proteins
VRKLKLREGTNTASLFGRHDVHLKLIEEELGVRISARGDELAVDGPGEAVRRAEQLLNELASLTIEGYELRAEDITLALRASRAGSPTPLKDLLLTTVPIATKKRLVAPKSATQKAYIEAIEKYDIVIGIGPAGTGKTYLAMAMAVSALREEKVSRIILTRPAVEAGEALGFLPGDLYEKIEPYLRPLHDALHDMLPAEEIQRHTERGIIEIAPLAYMRGRTLNHAFIILDEAQNSTAEQMFMFLTRLGFNSKVVITGDETQVDLPPHKRSGLLEAHHALSHTDGIAIVEFTRRDVVRHPLVQRIIAAYEEHRGKGG